MNDYCLASDSITNVHIYTSTLYEHYVVIIILLIALTGDI